MDSDDEIMFCQMMGEETALADDEENEMVMAAVLEAMAVEAAEPKHEDQEKGAGRTRTGTGQLATDFCMPTISRTRRRTHLRNFAGVFG